MPYVLLFTALAAWYLPPVVALYFSTIKIKKFGIYSLSFNYGGRANIYIDVELTNNTVFKLDIREIKAKLYINDKFVAEILNTEAQILHGKGSKAMLRANIQFDLNTVLTTIFKDLILGNISQAVLGFTGTMKANGKSYPFNLKQKIAGILEIKDTENPETDLK